MKYLHYNVVHPCPPCKYMQRQTVVDLQNTHIVDVAVAVDCPICTVDNVDRMEGGGPLILCIGNAAPGGPPPFTLPVRGGSSLATVVIGTSTVRAAANMALN